MKNINKRIIVNSSFLSWFKAQVELLPFQTNETKEIVSDISRLIDNEIEYITIEKEGNSINYNLYEENISVGELIVYPEKRRVICSGNEVKLTPKEYEILYFLLKNQGIVFTKEQIYKAVWGDDYLLDDSNIMAFIRKLRKKIELNPDSPEYILTIWGVGYKFNDML